MDERDEILQQLEKLESLRALLDEQAYQAARAQLEAQLAAPEPEALPAPGGDRVAGDKVAGDKIVIGELVVNQLAAGESQEQEARQAYLERFYRKCQALPLVELGSDPDLDEDVRLEDVYIALDTTQEKAQQPGRAKEQFIQSGRGQLLPALEAALQSPRMALLGDPGAGKSTFARNLLARQALAGLGGAALGTIPTDLLPVFITLRYLGPRLEALHVDNLPADRRQAELAGALRDLALEELSRVYCTPQFDGGMRQALENGRCWLALDGLDEVPERLRWLFPLAVQATLKEYGMARILTTCRVRSYQGTSDLPGFTAYTLAPFSDEQIRNFCQAWYKTQRRLGKLEAQAAGLKADDLSRAALSPDLSELSSNPLLLTSMAIIHQRDVGLPRQRVRLYKLAVEVLMQRWQKGKYGESGLALDPALAEALKDDRKLRRILERLAYEGQRSGKNRRDAAELTFGRAVEILRAPQYLGSAGLAEAFLDYVDQRAGLLLGQGGIEQGASSYTFPHRTFQEYLAGCYLLGQPQAARGLLEHASEAETWNLAVELGAEEQYFNGTARGEGDVLDLAYSLLPAGAFDTPARQRAVLWSGRLARLLGRAAIEADNLKDGSLYLHRLIASLQQLFDSQLTPPERADAGDALDGLGWLPDDLHRFVEIPYPAGAFWLAKYPVTNGQYERFLKAGDFADPALWQGFPKFDRRSRAIAGDWGEAGWQWLQQELQEPENAEAGVVYPFYWNDPRFGMARGGAPVVGVSWWEANAYCRWLGRHWGELEEGREQPQPAAVRLPCEAEWVFAAGGEQPEGRYAWDAPGQATTEMAQILLRANVRESGIGRTTVVGQYPQGASKPYGLFDLSGNLWEWQANYADQDHALLGLRGGSWYDGGKLARVAIRGGSPPVFLWRYQGFRPLAVPQGMPL